MKKDPRVYLAQILERIDRIREYTIDGKAAFFADPRTQDAVIRNFEVIGEAAKRIPDEYRKNHPSIPVIRNRPSWSVRSIDGPGKVNNEPYVLIIKAPMTVNRDTLQKKEKKCQKTSLQLGKCW